MDITTLKKQVYDANMLLPEYKLVVFTWGNVSGIDRERGLIVIKPSGVAYDSLTAEDMTVVDMDGRVADGKYKPSSDTATHIELYKAFPEIGGVAHTHSAYAAAFAQARAPIAAYGTTHADYFYGEIPCTRVLTKEEVASDYEKNTGKVIIEAFKDKDANAVPGVIVANHGPFTWGKSAAESVHNAVVLDEIAKMAVTTVLINPKAEIIERYILDKHYLRKHGKDAYYGQK